MSGLDVIELEVRELLRRKRIDPTTERAALQVLVDDVVRDYESRSLHGGMEPLSDAAEASRKIVDSVAGLGPLQQYLDDPTVEELWINEPSRVFVARGGVSELTPTILSDQQVRNLVERMLKPSGRRVDLSSPFVDATLEDVICHRSHMSTLVNQVLSHLL